MAGKKKTSVSPTIPSAVPDDANTSSLTAFLTSIQYTINRMGSNSVIFKTLYSSMVAVSVAAYISFFTIATNCAGTKNYLLAFGICAFLLISGILLSILDAYYLRLERGYVNLYNYVAKTKSVNGFDYKPIITHCSPRHMTENASDTERLKNVLANGVTVNSYERTRLFRCLFSVSVLWFYSVLFAVSSALILCLNFFKL